MNEWISVEDRLPKTDDDGCSNWFIGRIRTEHGNGATMPIRMDFNEFVWVESSRKISNDIRVTHWMPLPEPPKEPSYPLGANK